LSFFDRFLLLLADILHDPGPQGISLQSLEDLLTVDPQDGGELGRGLLG